MAVSGIHDSTRIGLSMPHNGRVPRYGWPVLAYLSFPQTDVDTSTRAMSRSYNRHLEHAGVDLAPFRFAAVTRTEYTARHERISIMPKFARSRNALSRVATSMLLRGGEILRCGMS